MKIVLNKTHLNAHGRRKETNDLTLQDFRLPKYYIDMDYKILYIRGNRCVVFKDRWPTEYKFKKLRDRLAA